MRRCPRGFPLLLLVAAFIVNGSVVDACWDSEYAGLPGAAGFDRHDSLVLWLGDTGEDRLRASFLFSDEPDFHIDRIFRAESVLEEKPAVYSHRTRRSDADRHGPRQALSAIGDALLLSRPPPPI